MAAKSDAKPPELKTDKPEAKAQAARDKNLELALQAIAKEYGEGSIMRLGDESSKLKVEVIPTGSIAIDTALGVGGFPRGRIIEVFGPESSGKTTLTLTVIAQAQKLGGVAAFIDVEHALDPSYARKLGVNMDELLVSQPDSGEEALTIAETLIKSNAVDVVVLDSVAALITKAELEGQMGDVTMGAQARLMSQAMRKLTSFISKSKTCAIFTNQIREKIGVMFGNPETTPGGKALKFYASVRVDIRRIAAIKTPDGTVLGNRTRVKIVKNKVAGAVPRGRVRHHVQRGHLARRLVARPCRRTQRHRQKKARGSTSKANRSPKVATPPRKNSRKTKSSTAKSRRPRWPSSRAAKSRRKSARRYEL